MLNKYPINAPQSTSSFPNHKRLSPLGKINLSLRARNDKRVFLQINNEKRGRPSTPLDEVSFQDP
jgi:hypothetical protein